MVLTRAGRTLLLLCLVSSAACTAARSGGDDANSPRRSSSVGHVVISVAEMTAPPSLLTLLQNRVNNVEVRRTSDCPEIEFRGQNSLFTSNPPSIYVDGQHTLNTCVLDMLNPHDIDVIEVYPAGVSNRPGYFSSMGGLILVFLKNGDEEVKEGDSQ